MPLTVASARRRKWRPSVKSGSATRLSVLRKTQVADEQREAEPAPLQPAARREQQVTCDRSAFETTSVGTGAVENAAAGAADRRRTTGAGSRRGRETTQHPK